MQYLYTNLKKKEYQFVQLSTYFGNCAGEYGQGFTIVAEQVGALAEQSAAATKEIASIVAAIQAETQEVNQAMESGTIQVVETTRLVENTKQSMAQVLEKKIPNN